MIYEKLIDKEKEKEKERLKEEHKQRRKLEIAFLQMLGKLQLTVDENSTWDGIRKSICEEEAFKAIPTEADRITLFKT